MFAKEDVQKALKLTAKQIETVDGTIKDVDADAKEIMQDLPKGDFEARQEAMKKVAAMRQKAMTKLTASLTSAQKAAWTKAPAGLRGQDGIRGRQEGLPQEGQEGRVRSEELSGIETAPEDHSGAVGFSGPSARNLARMHSPLFPFLPRQVKVEKSSIRVQGRTEPRATMSEPRPSGKGQL